MAAIFKVWRQMENPTPSVEIYSRNIPAKFHPNPISNDGALGLFRRGRPQQKQQQQQNEEICDCMRSVPDLKKSTPS